MEPQQTSFDTFGRWLVTRLRADLAQDVADREAPLYRFFTDLYEDMLADPSAYSIPYEPFVTFFARVTLTPEETAQVETARPWRR